MGNEISKKDAEAQCDPIVTNEDAGKTLAFDGTTILTDSDVAIPCGLIAKSFFTDSYLMSKEDGTPVTIDQDDIAWKSDVEFKFKNQPGDNEEWKTK